MTGIDHQGGRVKRVRTERGDIEAEVVVIAAGMFSAEVGRLAGIRVPIQPMSHEFIVTQPFRQRDPANPLPTLRDPDLLVYFREDGGGLLMGGYERPSSPAFLPDERGFESIPPDFNGRLLEDDWDRFEEIVVNSRRRVPEMENAKVTRMVNGPEGFTPDNEFCLGETEIGGLFVAAGCAAQHGLAGAGGVGKVMAEWIAAGEPSLDLWHMGHPALRRPLPLALVFPEAGPRDLRDLLRHQVPGPRARGGPTLARVAGQRLAARSDKAAFGEKSGWGERVNWYDSNAGAGDEELRPARVGRPQLVSGDRRRSAAPARQGRRALRRELVCQAGDRRARGGRASGAALRQPRRARGRPHHVYADGSNSRGGIELRLHGQPGSARSASRS